MSLDKFASADGKPPPKPAVASIPEETDEDLFDFDELTVATSKVAAEMKKELDEALGQVEAAKVDVSKTVAPPAAAAAPSAPPVKPVAAPKPAPKAAPTILPVTPPPSPNASLVPTVVYQKLTVSPLAAALLGGVVLANVTLMVFAWRSVNATKQLVLDVAHDMRDTTSDLRVESGQRTEMMARDATPVFGALPEGYRTLEIAKERIERREFARARRMLFGLLAVVDRIEQPARSELEAQASFLIADSFRLEGDTLVKPAEVLR